MNILNLENITKTYMEKTVLDGVNIGIDDSDKIGVVGSNGTGKSTLLSWQERSSRMRDRL